MMPIEFPHHSVYLRRRIVAGAWLVVTATFIVQLINAKRMGQL